MIFIILITIIVGFFIFKKFNKKVKPNPRPIEVENFSEKLLFPVAGANMAGRKKAAQNAYPNQKVFFEKEPQNKYDANAIKISSTYGLLGYVPSDKTKIVSELIEKEHQSLVYDTDEREYTDDGKEKVYIDITIVIKHNKQNSPE